MRAADLAGEDSQFLCFDCCRFLAFPFITKVRAASSFIFVKFCKMHACIGASIEMRLSSTFLHLIIIMLSVLTCMVAEKRAKKKHIFYIFSFGYVFNFSFLSSNEYLKSCKNNK